MTIVKLNERLTYNCLNRIARIGENLPERASRLEQDVSAIATKYSREETNRMGSRTSQEESVNRGLIVSCDNPFTSSGSDQLA